MKNYGEKQDDMARFFDEQNRTELMLQNRDAMTTSSNVVGFKIISLDYNI